MPDFKVGKLVLSHFRSHRRSALVFDGRPAALYGPNGAGKTNVLEALSLLSPGRGLRRAGAADLVRRPEAIGWKLSAEIAGHEVEVEGAAEGTRLTRINGKAAPQVALGRIARILWLVPAMDRLWTEAAEGRRRFLDRAALSFFPDHAVQVLAYERAMRERNRLLKEGVRDARWYDALEAQMADHGAAINRTRLRTVEQLAGAQDQAEGPFPAAALNLNDDGAPPATEAAGLARMLAEGRARDLAAGRTLAGPHRSDLGALYAAKGLPAAQCSTGEQKALLISLVLANARAVSAAEGAPPILLLDEVAAHLDSAHASALYDAITGLGAQAFMTGTGPELFRPLAGRAQFFEVRELDGSSQVGEGAGTE